MMLETVLDYISRTNLFNFIIFAGIILYLFFKLDVLGGLQKGADSVSENIEASKDAKTESENNLSNIEDKVAHLEEEVESIINNSEENAKFVGEKIVKDAQNTAESIKNNSLKLIDNKTAIIRNDIMKRASLASVEVARNHIIGELNNNADLHNRLIDESVEAINEVDA